MADRQRSWHAHIQPLSFWSVEHTAWMDLILPIALQPQQELWLDLGRVFYGMAELHFSCEEMCLVHMCTSETLIAIQDNRVEEHEYRGHGQYPVMLGQQVLRFVRLRVQKPCFLMDLLLWSRHDPLYPACPVLNEHLEGMWLNACSVMSFCWQQGLWYQPSARAAANIYSVWVLGPAIFSVAGALQDWKNDLIQILQQYYHQDWLEDSPMASLWFFLCLGEYYHFSKDEDLFYEYGHQIKTKLDGLLHCCLHNGRIACPQEPIHSLWHHILVDNAEEILMAQQTTLFWALSGIKHLVFHLGWMEQFVKIEHLLAVREEFWLFPHTSVGAALAVLGDLPDRRSYFLPQMLQYHDMQSPVEIILLIFALAKRHETETAKIIMQEYWLGKSALYPPAAENPYRPVKDAYILSAWDAMPINLIPIVYTRH